MILRGWGVAGAGVVVLASSAASVEAASVTFSGYAYSASVGDGPSGIGAEFHGTLEWDPQASYLETMGSVSGYSGGASSFTFAVPDLLPAELNMQVFGLHAGRGVPEGVGGTGAFGAYTAGVSAGGLVIFNLSDTGVDGLLTPPGDLPYRLPDEAGLLAGLEARESAYLYAGPLSPPVETALSEKVFGSFIFVSDGDYVNFVITKVEGIESPGGGNGGENPVVPTPAALPIGVALIAGVLMRRR